LVTTTPKTACSPSVTESGPNVSTRSSGPTVLAIALPGRAVELEDILGTRRDETGLAGIASREMTAGGADGTVAASFWSRREETP
jgi:hypothetical protein